MRENNRFEETQSSVKGLEYKTTGEILIISAIMMYIVSAFSFLILPFSENMNVFIFGLIVAGATGIVIYGGFQLSFYHKLNETDGESSSYKEINSHGEEQIVVKQKPIHKKEKDSISSIFSLLATMCYLYMGFMYGLWHPGWIIFLLIPIGNAILELVKNRKRY